MGQHTHISDRFEWWSVADCACEYCLYCGKKRTCQLEACVVDDIRQEAIRREQAERGGSVARMEAVSCPA